MNKRSAFLRRLPAVALTISLLTGCAGPRASGGQDPGGGVPEEQFSGQELDGRGQTLSAPPAADSVFTLNYDPEGSMNPIRVSSATNYQFFSLIYDCVFTVDEDFTFSSDVITEYHTDDFSWWVFTVDTSICFSDGTPLTAKDVAYSIRMCQQSSYYASRLRSIYGCSAVDESTFAISASRPNSQLPATLNVPIIKYGELNEEFPAGTGPYRLNEDHTALERVPNGRHAAELPLDTIYLHDYMDPTERITAFEEGRLDLVTNDPAGMYNLGYGGAKETRYYDTTNLHYIGFNTRSNYFQTYLTRCAVSYLLDRDYLVKNLMHGSADIAVLPCHPRSSLYDAGYAESVRYDPEMAARLFQEGGVEDLDDDGALEVLVTGIVVELRVKFVVNTDSAVKVLAARRLTEELNSLGITTSLYELGWEEYIYALASGDFDLYYGEMRLGPDWNLRPLFEVPNAASQREGLWGLNYARTTDLRYGELYNDYLAADETERYDRFQEAARYVVDSGLILPLCFERREILTHRDAVSGIHPTQYDLFNRFTEWNISFQP